MATEAYREHKPAISFSPPVPLTTEFYKKTSSENLREAAKILLGAYKDPFGVKNTPMGKELAYILKNPEKVLHAQAIFGVEPTNKAGEAIYSVKITTKNETHIFSLRVGKDSTELSYVKNNELAERHYQKGSEVIHEVIA